MCLSNCAYRVLFALQGTFLIRLGLFRLNWEGASELTMCPVVPELSGIAAQHRDSSLKEKTGILEILDVGILNKSEQAGESFPVPCKVGIFKNANLDRPKLLAQRGKHFTENVLQLQSAIYFFLTSCLC